MIMINQDGAYMVTPYKRGYLVRTYESDSIRKMMSRIHNKKWVLANLADEIIHTPRADYPWRIKLTYPEFHGYTGSVTRDMDYESLFNAYRKQEDVTEKKLKGLASVLMHMDKGWRQNGSENK